jgi:translation initiation factor IF-1
MPERGASPTAARVVEGLPSGLFRVELLSAGRPRAEVLVELSPADPGRGRIVALGKA